MTVAVDPTSWMPDSLSAEDKAEFVAAATVTRTNPLTGDETTLVDDHLAAALAWEHYAATGAGGAEQTAPDVTSVTTGSQTITYQGEGTRVAAALKRAAHHRARSRPYTAPLSHVGV